MPTADIEAALDMPDARHRIEETADIAAPIDVVWRVMTDLADYGAWNPFVVAMRAPDGLSVGERLILSVRLGRWPMRVAERIERLDPPDAAGRARLVYHSIGLGPALGAVRVRRVQRLEALGPQSTRYTTVEFFAGWMSALVPVGAVRRGTRGHADGLARQSERLANPVAHDQ